VFRQLRPSCSLQIFPRQNTRKRRPRRCSTPDVVGVSTQTGCQKLKHQEVPALILINQGPDRRGLEAAALGGLADSAGCHAKKKRAEPFVSVRTGRIRSVNLRLPCHERLTAADDKFYFRAITKSVNHVKLISQKAEHGRIVLPTWVCPYDYKKAAFF
jgi:hypothetical protein